MKVLVGDFVNEANANVPNLCETKDFDLAFGDECIDKMEIRDVFEKQNIEIIPSVYAVAGAAGVIRRRTFDYILSCFTDAVKKHLNEIDGIFLMLHGASEVEGLGSGDHQILWAIRKIVGPYLPIAVACDPHGNLCKEYTDQIQILRSYRESPHTDATATRRKVAGMLCDLLKDRQNIHAVYRKLPLIIGGEQSVSADEPVRSINAYMDELEKDPRVRSASWHVGYIRHDTYVAGAGIVVIPQNTEDQEYCEKVADDLAKFVWDRHKEFHYTGRTAEPEEALRQAMQQEGTVSITDSGDNTTSGAGGWNTYILRQALALKNNHKKFLFASINDPKAFDSLKDLEIGTKTHIRLGVGYDELSAPVELDVTVKSKGELVRTLSLSTEDDVKHVGDCVTVHIEGTAIDVVVANNRQAMRENAQYKHANVDWHDYDIVVIKVGYNCPLFTDNGRWWIMSLTDGATLQNTAKLKFKRIMRPMYPIDNI